MDRNLNKQYFSTIEKSPRVDAIAASRNRKDWSGEK